MNSIDNADIRALKTFFRTQDADLRRIQDTIEEIEILLERLNDPGHTTDALEAYAYVVSLASACQMFHTGVENLLKNGLKEIDLWVPSGEAWHRKLLEQASMDQELHPAVLDPATHDHLEETMKFRHFVRNAYGIRMDKDRVLSAANHALSAHRGLTKGYMAFEACVLAKAAGLDSSAGGDPGNTTSEPPLSGPRMRR